MIVGRPPTRREREPTSEDLAEDREIRAYPEPALRAGGPDAEAR